MPQKKQRQELLGIHHVLPFHREIKKFAMKNPGLIRGTKEFQVVFEAASLAFFFADMRFTKKRIVYFGQSYMRNPDAVLELMRSIRRILSKWRKTESGKVREFLLTHQTVFVDNRRPVYDDNGNCVAMIVKSKLDDTEERISVSNLTSDKINELTRSKLVAVSSLLDKEIATLLNVKPESVKKARQSIARQDEQIAFWENPEVVRYMQTGIITPKLKRIWGMRAKGKK